MLAQAASFAVIGLALFWAFQLTSASLNERGVTTGFDFLGEPARTAVANAPFAFQPGIDSNGLALVVGAVNTLKISAFAIIASTLLGFLIGLGRLSRNRLARGLCVLYVEGVRNVPVLIHLSIWYGIVLLLPAPREANLLLGTFMATNRGVFVSFPEHNVLWIVSMTAAALVLALVAIYRKLTPHRSRHAWQTGSLLVLIALCAPWIIAGESPAIGQPIVTGFRVVGGLDISPEYAAFVIALSIYTASFVSEIVRASIQAVPRGQWEAATALALSPHTTMRSIVLPQAVRVAIPPLSNEYIGVIKNSSLAVVIGYQEIVGVGNTVLFDTGQAVEVMAVLAGFFIVVSLVLSGVMNIANARFRSAGD
ncbi:MAG: ABC transporter permease subunit [Burkholderiaceae bacterium]